LFLSSTLPTPTDPKEHSPFEFCDVGHPTPCSRECQRWVNCESAV